MDNQNRYLEYFEIMKSLMRKIEKMHPAESHLFRTVALNPLAAEILGMFEDPDYQSICIHHKLELVASNGINASVEHNHKFIIFAREKKHNLDDYPSTSDDFVNETVPLIRRLALKNLDSGEWHGMVADLSHRLNNAFGTVSLNAGILQELEY
jgi:hypothetical protein